MEEFQFLGISVFNSINFFELLIRFSFNFVVSIVLIRYLYYKKTYQESYVFSFVLLSSIVFLLVFLLASIKIKLGFALGLFAIFGIIRYRTHTIPIKEMTYLFAVIGIAVINAIAHKEISYAELLLSNIVILSIVYVFECFWLNKQWLRKEIVYEKIELITPENNTQLKQDIEDRTGLIIQKIEIESINFLNDTAKIIIYYKPKKA